MNKENFKKGEDFEMFCIENIFKQKHFDILELSHNYNGKFFVESNLNPDIKFRCKTTKKEFWIECKFISKLKFENPIKKEQLIRYYKLKDDVFYLFGFGNESENPSGISLIPLKRMYSNLKIYKIKDSQIEVSPIKNFNELLELTEDV